MPGIALTTHKDCPELKSIALLAEAAGEEYRPLYNLVTICAFLEREIVTGRMFPNY